jgi:dipeptidyl aminopeptidase/acylaminoacyl peptidase
MRAHLRAICMFSLVIHVSQIAAYGESHSSVDPPSQQGAAEPRPVTVQDMIQMTQPGEPEFQGAMVGKDDIGIFSPDRRLFLILLKRGNLQKNTNEYWLKCFHSNRAMLGDPGITLTRFSSSSNRPAIHQVRWISNTMVTFLAETREDVAQLYSLDVKTRKLTKLTSSRDSLTAYATSPRFTYIAFSAEMPEVGQTSDRGENGQIVVRNQPLLDLLLRRRTFEHNAFSDLYIQNGRSGAPSKVKIEGNITDGSKLYPSPDGHHLIVKSLLSGKLSPEWYGYNDSALESQLPTHEGGGTRFIYQFQMVDIDSRTSRPLLNSPIPIGDYPDVLWAPDSRSVLLSDILLPLDESNREDEEMRRSKKFLVELCIKNGKITPITTRSVRLRSWNASTGRVVGLTGSWSGAGSLSEGHPVDYKKSNGIWEGTTADGTKIEGVNRIDVTLVEDMNSPPKIFVKDRETSERRLLLDLNPQFVHLAFGKVQDLGVLESKGFSVKAGVYLPVGYRRGVRYPLVIQTHEWSPDRFWIDGPFDSAFAAQAFAGKGFIVAQIAMNRTHQSTLKEVEEEAKGYDTVISYLDEHGLIDISRIGIIGFSRTALGVKHALVHSKYHFAAATIADGSDVGYFRYIAYVNSNFGQTEDAEGVNGGIPVGDGIQSWLRAGQDFELPETTTPIRLEAYDPGSLLFTWEEFGILSRLRKPVDFIYLPGADHVLVKPLDRLASQGGNVDWFAFWLLKDGIPGSRNDQQFVRWTTLKGRGSARNDRPN